MKFPVPHDIKAKTIPGTEGWERMYPYQYQFVTDDPVRNQYEKDTFWFYDGLHYPEPLYPFDTIWDEAWFLALSQFNNRIFMVPPVRGVDHRMINGYPTSPRCRSRTRRKSAAACPTSWSAPATTTRTGMRSKPSGK